MEPPSPDLLPTFIALFKPVTFEIAIALAVATLLLLCSALISGSEVAYFSLEPADRELLSSEKDKDKSAERILALLDRPQRLLATILIANNFVNIGIVILSSFIIDVGMSFTGYAAWVPILFQVGVVTFLLLLLGEVLPKVYATDQGLKLCRMMSLPLMGLLRAFHPLSSLLMSSSNLIHKRIKKYDAEYSPEELEQALELTRDEATSEDEEKILKGIVRFGNTDAKQILTPRTEVLAFEVGTPFTEMLSELLEEGFSRVPVYRHSLDQVEGILYLKDLLPYSEENDFDWSTLLRKPYFIPENKKLDDLLKEFQNRKMHMAVVVDEYGGTSGIVTLEDIIEEIVGDITDEFDDEDIFYSKLDDHSYIFEGKTPLVDLYKILDIDGSNWEEVKGESDTLAGFMLEMSGRLLNKNEKLKFENYILTVEAADKRRIKRIKLNIVPVEENQEQGKSR